MTTPATNGNGHVYSDEDITMNTATEAVTDTNMEIDRHSIPSPIWARLYDRHPNVMNEIWKRICTAQSTVPGVHIFSLEVPRPRYENAFTPRWMPLGPPKLGPRDGGYGWYFRNANIAPASFDAHNPSTYLIDSGLWTACKQSRDIMLEEYGLENWRRILVARPGIFKNELKRQNLMDLPAIVYFKDKGKDRYFSLFPNKDLIFLQSTKI
ncbi:hypothetical protein THARTR1_01375 [Trichoderma harzianum]|uniref:Uncharacterized protein n=1 Tax=Trichoderma harzianum TaxID=5544 RepID=A0A2K0UMV8_TRIHA|nr:hypothetical protein THARTR1_01375 [Trichoderma harzianum]